MKEETRGSLQRDPVAFGDLITFDHLGLKGQWKDSGIGEMLAAINVLDLATKYKSSIPVANYGAGIVKMRLREFAGHQTLTNA